MNFPSDKYEAVSNAASFVAVAAAAIVCLAALIGAKAAIISSADPLAISIEYSDFFEKAAPQEVIEEVLDEEAIDEQIIKKEVKRKEVKKREKVPEKNVSDEPSLAAQQPALSNVHAVNLSENQEFMNHFLRLVQKSLYYPKTARKAGISGIVEIKVTFSASGEIKNVGAAGRKYPKILGEAALKTMERVKKDWRPLLNPHKEQSVIIPVSFELTN
jgi:TonB family protein